jgi:DNA-binding NarL/FixJ family response regulator
VVTTTSNGTVRPEHAFPLGLIWLKGKNRVDFLGLEHALSVAARIYKGSNAPPGKTSASAVFCWPTGEDDLAAQVSNIRGSAPEAVVLVVASTPDLRLARASLRAGASGLIHSGMTSEQVLRAVSVAIRGEVVLPRELLRRWMDERRPPDLSVLPARQKEIVELLVEGLSNAEIAQRLFLAESTIKKHLRAAYKVLGVRTRNEAADLFLRGSSRSGRRSVGHREPQHWLSDDAAR